MVESVEPMVERVGTGGHRGGPGGGCRNITI